MKHSAPDAMPPIFTNAGMYRKEKEESTFIAKVAIKPMQQFRMSLGQYASQFPRGFCLEFTDEYDKESVVAQITSASSSKTTKTFMLHIANYADRAVRVEVWEL